MRPFDTTLGPPESRSEVRAVYGGFGLAIAAVLALAAVQESLQPGILITVGAALGGMAFGRIVFRVGRQPDPFYPNGFYCIVEAVAAAALFLVAW